MVRAVAREVGVSHNAAYRHFADRDALLAAVSARAMAGLVEEMRRQMAAVTGEDPVLRSRRRLRACGTAYVEFALAEPGLFRVAFGSEPEQVLDASGDPVDTNPYGVLVGALDDLATAGWLHPDRRAGAETTCWSTVHGFAMLHLDGPLRGEEDAGRADGLGRTLAMLELGLAVPDDLDNAG